MGLSRGTAHAVGLHEDFARWSYFLRAPRRGTIDGRLTRSDGSGHEAATYAVATHYPVRSHFLMEADVSVVTVMGDSVTEQALGDVRFRIRGDVWTPGRRSVHILGGIRAGSGSETLFPYASGSVDFEAGLAYVDTLAASTTAWVSASGVLVTRLDDVLEIPGLYGHHAWIAGGIVLPPIARTNLQIGAAGFFYRSAGSRVVYFSDVDVQLNTALSVIAAFQLEGGDRSSRATDFALVVGARVFY